MKNIRLLPVVVLAVAALLVLKTFGLVTNGGYVLTGVGSAQAAGGGGGHGGGDAAPAADGAAAPTEPTLQDTSPTLSDSAPTVGGAAPAADAGGGHGAPAASGDHGATTDPATLPEIAAAPTPLAQLVSNTYCVDANATLTDSGEVVLAAGSASASGGHGEPAADAAASGEHGETAPAAAAEPVAGAAPQVNCLPSGDAVPMRITSDGQYEPMNSASGVVETEQQLLERLAGRRDELQKYEQDLAMRASIVDAAEKRIEERTTTLQALEAQISALVDQRQQLESDQFAGIVSMYEAMKPKDAATIFNNLDMNVLLRVSKTMSPRKMAPILAAMDAARAQELTVKMADLADQPVTEMTPDDLAALPQIVGQ